MDLTWAAVIQSLIIALCTWYMRRGSKNDRIDGDRNTREILDRVKALDKDMRLVKSALSVQNELLKECPIQKRKEKKDHNGPKEAETMLIEPCFQHE